MRILGIDPGIGRTGWGVIDTEGQKLTVKDFGCIETPAGMEIGERIEQIYDRVGEILDEYNPDSAGIEELFFNTNSKTAFVVGQARGVMMLAVTKKKIPLSIYTPLQVKIAVTGYGRAEKRQVAQMVKTLLKLESIPKLDDTTDALAIAITHAFSYRLKNEFGKNPAK
ncbi:MAG TPA: crossover junction endodeoxyribonuclease RuvC [Candidatus Limnocylindrales bacterium]|nr:crossover junction endodeoxyribonuclease RuvC [Candidatus Limnocylindrales bacterium]